METVCSLSDLKSNWDDATYRNGSVNFILSLKSHKTGRQSRRSDWRYFEATNKLYKYFACLHIASLIKPWLSSNIIQTYRAPKTRFTVQKKTTQVKKFLFHPSGTTAKWMGWIIPNPGISGSEPFILSRSIKYLPETHADLLVEW